MRELKIGTRTIGAGHPVYFIAEAGSNHDRSLKQAHELVDVAAKSGADAVKFQVFRAQALYPRTAGMTDYLAVPRSIFDIIRDLEMPLEWLGELAQHARELGIDFLATPFDETSADAIDPFVPAFKIASYEMTHEVLVQHCARKGKPMIVSTGTAYLDEVREMIAAVRAVGCDELVVLQCTAKYPAPLSAINLRAMAAMGEALGVPIGFSDHSREALAAPMAAAALGACVIEKHFTLDNDLPGPDHAYALEPDELAAVIAGVRQTTAALGKATKEPAPEEEELRSFARRSLFTTRALAAGETLTMKNIAALRAGKLKYGLHPRRLVHLLGSVTKTPLAEEATLLDEHLAPASLKHGSVTLRPHAITDTEHVLAWRNLPAIANEMFADRPPTRVEHEAWVERLQRRTDRLEWIILDGSTPVGTISLSNIDFGARRAEYGVLLDPRAHGRGLATSASQLVLDFAFDALDLDTVFLELFADNAAAKKLYEHLGFTDEATKPRVRNRDVLRMKLSRAAWTTEKGKR